MHAQMRLSDPLPLIVHPFREEALRRLDSTTRTVAASNHNQQQQAIQGLRQAATKLLDMA